jgi:tRNA dimethylallyltransferase
VPDYLVLVGPTASGKSALAMRLAGAGRGEIVSGDAFQVYRGFDIGTGKPSPADRAGVPHHLLDILQPHEPYSAGAFARRAAAAIAEARARGRLPIVVVGSGLYLRALCEGLSPMPLVPAAVRRHWRARLATDGLDALRRELLSRDPRGAARTAPGDTQRTLRALEVHDATGIPWSSWIEGRGQPATPWSPLVVGLTVSRAVLYDRIHARLREMIARGWVSEVDRLLARGLDPSLPAFRAIGYRQLARHLRGELSLHAALEVTAVATRRYAKRQETWLRHQADPHWMSAPDPDAVLDLLEG